MSDKESWEDDIFSYISIIEEKVKTIQYHANKLGEIITGQTMKRLELEEMVEKLEEQITIKILENAKGVQVLSNLETRVNELDANYLSAIKLADTYKAGWEEVESRIKELESDLKLNASMLSKQCDLAREAETERECLSNAIDKHERWKRDHEKVISLIDEELYQARKATNE